MRPQELEKLARGGFALRDVVTTDELALRPSRVPDYEAENAGISRILEAMAQSPQTVLQELVDEAKNLCGAGSAGISLLDDNPPAGEVRCFRWRATSGEFAPLIGSTLPRDFSPCGSVLDESRMLLMSDPVRHFAYIQALPAPVREVLLMPFYRDGIAIGTVWVVAHTPERRFDREDARMLERLSKLAAAALQVLASADHARVVAETELARVQARNRVLADADREKSDFLATLTHELRNVLAPISNALDVIRLADDRAVRTQAREMAERQLAQMNRLTSDLLDTSRIANGKLSIDAQQLDLCSIVQSAVDAARTTIERSEQRVTFSAPGESVPVVGDDTRLAQVFGNLLSNAARYGRAGGVVKVSVERVADEAVVRVKDFGIGIAPAMLPRVFDLFFQADRTTTRTHGGLGIGLTLVRRLVELQGGRVEARSDGISTGSEFIVALPLGGPAPLN